MRYPIHHSSGIWKTTNYKVPSPSLWTEKLWNLGTKLVFVFYAHISAFWCINFVQNVRKFVPFLLHNVMQWLFIQPFNWDTPSYYIPQKEAHWTWSCSNYSWCSWWIHTCSSLHFSYSILVNKEKENWSHICIKYVKVYIIFANWFLFFFTWFLYQHYYIIRGSNRDAKLECS